MVTGLAGQPSASSEEDTANFQGKDKHDPAPRVELATVKEEEWQNGQSSDAVTRTAVLDRPKRTLFRTRQKSWQGTKRRIWPSSQPPARQPH
jgi:hypothetical protein